MMEDQQGLMAAFPQVTRQQWVDQATKDLKGAAFEVLEYTTPDGIKVAPFYTKEDIATPAPLFTHTDWEVCESIEVWDAAAANKQALDVLNRGATALIFKLWERTSFEELLQDIGIEYIGLQLQLMGDALWIAEDFKGYAASKNLTLAALNITINHDPLESLITNGHWALGEMEDAAEYRSFVRTSKGSRNICINAAIYHNAGAPPAYQLGCMLAHANEYMTWLDGDITGIELQVNTATGPDYFMEMAKLRALRKVFGLLLKQYDLDTPVYIHATSAERNLTVYDQHNNLLRTTTEAMAAVAGGCNSLQVLPFNAIIKHADDFSLRMARNIQLILKGESYLDKVSDVAAGSYFIETLTEELAQKAWTYFQAIEAQGGLISALKNGRIQETIRGFAAQEQQLFDEGKNILVGTNKFPVANQQMSEVLEVEVVPEIPSKADIQPLVAQRLSAKMEIERLANEVPHAS